RGGEERQGERPDQGPAVTGAPHTAWSDPTSVPAWFRTTGQCHSPRRPSSAFETAPRCSSTSIRAGAIARAFPSSHLSATPRLRSGHPTHSRPSAPPFATRRPPHACISVVLGLPSPPTTSGNDAIA